MKFSKFWNFERLRFSCFVARIKKWRHLIGWFLTSRDFVVFLLSYILGLSNDKSSNESQFLCFRPRKLRRRPFLPPRPMTFCDLFLVFWYKLKAECGKFSKILHWIQYFLVTWGHLGSINFWVLTSKVKRSFEDIVSVEYCH